MPSLRDRLLASDPPVERLRLAARATLAILLAGVVLLPMMKHGLVPGPSAALGALMGMWSTLMANDPDPRARRVTSVVLAVPAIAGVVCTALLGIISPILANASIVAVAFFAIWVRKFGPRWFALGMMALFATFFALFIRITPAMLGPTAAAIIIGTAAAYIVRFGLVRDDPHIVLRAAATAFRARARLFAATLRAVANGEESAPRRRLRREAGALNGAALALESLLAGEALALAPDDRYAKRLLLLEVELALEALASAALVQRSREDDAAVDAALEALARNDRAGAHARLDASAQPGAPAVAPIRAAARALDRLDEALRDARRARATRTADAPLSPMARPPQVGPLAPTTRQAVQVAVATGAAMLLGTAVPPHQYFWAVLTAFIVYNGTASSAEARRRTWGRVVGTALGVCAGFVLVDFVKNHAALELALSVVFLFFAMYAFRISYGVFTFLLTGLVAMVYDLVGRPTDQLLIARLIETIVGAVCGGAAATFVLPLRTRSVVAVTARGFVERLRSSLAASVARIAGEPGDDPLDAARALDAQLGELLARLAPLVVKTRNDVPHNAEETLDTLASCGYRSRALAGRALHGPPAAGAERDRLRASADAIRATLAAFETVLDGRPEIVPDDVGTADAAEAATARDDAPPAVAAVAHDLRVIAEDVARLSGAQRALLLPAD